MRKNFGEFGNTKGYRNTMRCKARRSLHEDEEEKELTLQEKIEKICNDKDLFEKNFWNLRLSEVYIECGQDLEEFADDTQWWGEKFFKFILDCYYLFDNEDYGYISTFFDEDEWIEAVREMCCDKAIWDYDNEYIVDDEDELILE